MDNEFRDWIGENYDTLRKIARKRCAEYDGQIQPTAIVNSVCRKLFEREDLKTPDNPWGYLSQAFHYKMLEHLNRNSKASTFEEMEHDLVDELAPLTAEDNKILEKFWLSFNSAGGDEPSNDEDDDQTLKRVAFLRIGMELTYREIGEILDLKEHVAKYKCQKVQLMLKHFRMKHGIGE